MKLIILACAATLALAGCANAINTVTGDINQVAGALSSPQATQAAANLKSAATSVACDITAVSADWQAINAAIAAGKVSVRDANTVYAVSAIACAALGGAVAAVSSGS